MAGVKIIDQIRIIMMIDIEMSLFLCEDLIEGIDQELRCLVKQLKVLLLIFNL